MPATSIEEKMQTNILRLWYLIVVKFISLTEHYERIQAKPGATTDNSSSTNLNYSLKQFALVISKSHVERKLCIKVLEIISETLDLNILHEYYP